MKTLVLANQKGGVGKSAVATLLAHRFAQRGLRVLAIDLDHQGNFTSPMALSKRAVDAGYPSDRIFLGTAARLPQQSFVLIPAGDGLLGLERQGPMHTPFARAFRGFLNASMPPSTSA